MTQISADRLREVLSYDKETGVFTWKMPLSNRIKVGAPAGNPCHGYVQIGISGKTYYAHRLAWLYCHGVMPPHEIDHKDGNRANNALSNLREATHKQNLENRRLGKSNTSGFLGVTWNKKNRNWIAYVTTKEGRKHVGSFANIEDAVHARAKAASEHYTHATDVSHSKIKS